MIDPARTPVLRLEKIGKRFADKTALDGVSLDVYAGEIVGLLGPNGAGKTTAIRVALNLIRTYTGTVSVFSSSLNLRNAEVRRRLGYVPEIPMLPELLRVGEFIEYLVALYQVDADRAGSTWKRHSATLGLDVDRREFIRDLSKGTREKVAIVGALLHDPKLLILDEPGSGLDPVGIAGLKKVITNVAEQGGAVLLSSHRLDMAQMICQRFCLLKAGQVIASGTFDVLSTRAGTSESLEAIFLALEQT